MLVSAVEERLALPLIPLIAAHYAWCLACTHCSKSLDQLLETCRRLAEAQALEARWCWRPAGLELVKVVGDAASGKTSDAWGCLGLLRGWIGHAGGSDAQAMVRQQTALTVAKADGAFPEVEAIVAAMRRDRSALTPLDRLWLSGISP